MRVLFSELMNMRMSLLQLPLLSPISCFPSTPNNIPISYPKFYVFSQMAKSSSNYVRNSYDNFVVRRSTNYQPPIWKYEFVQSLTSEFMVICLFTYVIFLVWFASTILIFNVLENNFKKKKRNEQHVWIGNMQMKI